jgi:hypothetical protein
MLSSEAQLKIVAAHHKKQAIRNAGKSQQQIAHEKNAVLAWLATPTKLEVEAKRVANLPEEERSKLMQEFADGGRASNPDPKERSYCRAIHSLIDAYIPKKPSAYNLHI